MKNNDEKLLIKEHFDNTSFLQPPIASQNQQTQSHHPPEPKQEKEDANNK